MLFHLAYLRRTHLLPTDILQRTRKQFKRKMNVIRMTKGMLKKKEEQDIRDIVRHIKERTRNGRKIITAFHDACGLDMESARVSGGGRSHHYDFEVSCTQYPEKWFKVEHKGSCHLKPILEEKPWLTGVQFTNQSGHKFLIAHKYAQRWYEKYVASGLLKEKFNLKSDIPSLEEWKIKDAWVQGNPKTEFGKELKKTYREKFGGSLLKERETFVKEWTIDEEDLNTLKQEAFTIANHVLKDKELWIQIHGDVNSEFNVKWTEGFDIKEIISVQRDEGKKDASFIFTCNDGFSFNGILRWGKGAGFSNIRFDLK